MTYKIAVCDDEQIFVDDVVKKRKEQSEQCEILLSAKQNTKN